MEMTGVTMIELLALKQEHKDGEATGDHPARQKRASATQLCIPRPISELNLRKAFQMEFLNQNYLLNFKVVICPEESFYRNGRFMVSFRASPNSPHEPPKVKCDTIVHHPNTDLDGNLLNLLKTYQMELPDPDDLLNFKLVICPEDSLYTETPNSPHEPPKVKSNTTVYYPNTDLHGDVCLNISGEDWKAVLTVNYTV
ncbi:hypothetical protein HPB50_028505 [Hyalomma asiaticum]|nr:hypothetical protein HPB50_028505 [Hyalomma asiaticum]